MSAEDLLTHCLAQGIFLSLSEGNLDIRAPKGVLTDELLQILRESKGELLMVLAGSLTPSTTEPSSWPLIPVAIECAESAAIFCLLLAADDLPPVPFRLNAWTEVLDANKMMRWLRSRILREPRGTFTKQTVLSADVLALRRIVLEAADNRSIELNT